MRPEEESEEEFVNEGLQQKIDLQQELEMNSCDSSNRPTRQREKIKSIHVREVDVGYIVEVGCAVFAIETKSQLVAKLNDYLNRPDDVERLWKEEGIF